MPALALKISSTFPVSDKTFTGKGKQLITTLTAMWTVNLLELVSIKFSHCLKHSNSLLGFPSFSILCKSTHIFKQPFPLLVSHSTTNTGVAFLIHFASLRKECNCSYILMYNLTQLNNVTQPREFVYTGNNWGFPFAIDIIWDFSSREGGVTSILLRSQLPTLIFCNFWIISYLVCH